MDRHSGIFLDIFGHEADRIIDTAQTTALCLLKLFDGEIAPLLKADQEAPDYRLSKKQPSSDTLLFEQARRWVHATDLQEVVIYKRDRKAAEGSGKSSL